MHKLTSSFLAALLIATVSSQVPDTSKIRDAANTAVASGDWTTAIASFKQLVEADPKDGKAWHMLGYSLHSSGRFDEALDAHIKASEFPEVAPVATYNVACVYAVRYAKDRDPANREAAFKWLEKVAKLGWAGADHMSDDADMDSLRNEPRYKEIVAEMERNATASPRVSVYAGTFERKLARMVLFGGNRSLGGVSIHYGQPQWKDSYEAHLESPKFENRRWRFGRDEWTTLDTSVPLVIGDQQLAAGIYYLTLERRGGEVVLAALDPSSVHKHTIDPYAAHMTKGGTEIVLKHEKVAEVSDALEIRLVEAVGAAGAGEMVVRFGPHKLSTKFAMQTKGGKNDKNAK